MIVLPRQAQAQGKHPKREMLRVHTGAVKGWLCILYVRAVPDGGSRVRGGPFYLSAVRLLSCAPSLAATRSAPNVIFWQMETETAAGFFYQNRLRSVGIR